MVVAGCEFLDAVFLVKILACFLYLGALWGMRPPDDAPFLFPFRSC